MAAELVQVLDGFNAVLGSKRRKRRKGCRYVTRRGKRVRVCRKVARKRSRR